MFRRTGFIDFDLVESIDPIRGGATAPVGPTPLSVNYAALAVGTPLAAAALPDGGEYRQAAGTSQTEEVITTSWGTTTAGAMLRWAFVADLARIGRAPNGLVGLRLDEPATNLWADWRTSTGTLAASGSYVRTADFDNGPDGTAGADRSVAPSGHTGGGPQITGGVSGTLVCSSAWHRRGVIGVASKMQHWCGWSSPNNFARMEDSLDTWKRIVVPGRVHTTGDNAVRIINGIDQTSFGGGVPGAHDVVTDFMMYESGRGFPSEPIQGSRAACLHRFAANKLVSGGRIQARVLFSPAGSPDRISATSRLIDHSAETTYVEFSGTTKKLTIVVAGGVAEVLAAPVGWDANYTSVHDVVEMYIAFGGGSPTRVRYRISHDGGSTWGTPFDPLAGAAGVSHGTISSSGSIGIFTAGGAAGSVMAGWIHAIEQVTVVPAWALTALPTDMASLRTWLRRDGGMSLGFGITTLTAWADQSATQRNFNQTTAANQPTLAAGQTGYGSAVPLYDATDHLRSVDTAASWNFLHDGTGCTVLVHWRWSSGSRVLLDTSNFAASTAHGLSIFVSGSTFRTIVSRGVAATYTIDFSITQAGNANNTDVLVYRFKAGRPGNEWRFDWLGAQFSGGSGNVLNAPSSTNATTSLAIGATFAGGGGNTVAVPIGEVQIYADYLDDTTVGNLRTDMMTRAAAA